VIIANGGEAGELFIVGLMGFDLVKIVIRFSVAKSCNKCFNE